MDSLTKDNIEYLENEVNELFSKTEKEYRNAA